MKHIAFIKTDAEQKYPGCNVHYKPENPNKVLKKTMGVLWAVLSWRKKKFALTWFQVLKSIF